MLTKKQTAEIQFWKKQLDAYQRWYSGDLALWYNTPSPIENEKIQFLNIKFSSILTWHKLHQEKKYIHDLMLNFDSFKGMKLLDVGSGPIPSATCFKDCEVYSLDPLFPHYLEIGFPLHCYDNSSRFIHAFAEDIPVDDDFFDAIISVNALDHVDNIEKTASEIKRVLKPNGLLRFHVHYHLPTLCEPIKINDQLLNELFGWCENLSKIHVSHNSFSTWFENKNQFVLWSNFI